MPDLPAVLLDQFGPGARDFFWFLFFFFAIRCTSIDAYRPGRIVASFFRGSCVGSSRTLSRRFLRPPPPSMTDISSLLWSVCICWEREALADFRLGGEREQKKQKTKCSLRPLRLRSIIYISHSRLGDAVHDAFFEAGFAVGNEKSGRERRKEGDTKRETFERERKQAQENIQSAAAKEIFSPLSLLN